MTSKLTLLREVQALIVPIIAQTHVYPEDINTIPFNIEPVCIVQELRATNNTTSVAASFCGTHNWNVEMLVIVGRGEVQYPSLESATFDILANDYELAFLTALVGAKFSDSVNNQDIITNIGWYQWEKARKEHEDVYALQVLLNITQFIDFT